MMAENAAEIIRVRRGIPGRARYCACDSLGNPIKGFVRLGDVRKYYLQAILRGKVRLVRELDRRPDTEIVNEILHTVDKLLLEAGSGHLE